MMRITAITIRTWIQLPVLGKFGLSLPPKAPSNHRITRMTTIVHNMGFLLFFLDKYKATRLSDRVADHLTVQYKKNASRNGEDGQDHAEAANTKKCYKAPSDKEDGQ
jgi:hypothetical protein